ncbi:MAG: hypothetical protein KKA07_08475 [Bacteroidetes bacterium]|nr:hypothetical protein [Bacteroidota bacterium]MBU1719096.1 hypothetical protein [Bacteroidota bacterium]
MKQTAEKYENKRMTFDEIDDHIIPMDDFILKWRFADEKILFNFMVIMTIFLELLEFTSTKDALR